MGAYISNISEGESVTIKARSMVAGRQAGMAYI